MPMDFLLSKAPTSQTSVNSNSLTYEFFLTKEEREQSTKLQKRNELSQEPFRTRFLDDRIPCLRKMPTKNAIEFHGDVRHGRFWTRLKD